MRKLVFALMLLLVGCTTPETPESVPEDFQLKYQTGATHAEWGTYALRIYPNGSAIFNKSAYNYSRKDSILITEKEMLDIYTVIVQNNFFQLKEEYMDPSIMDGGYSKITVNADGKEHTVTVVNTEQEQFNKLEDKINEIILKRSSISYGIPTNVS